METIYTESEIDKVAAAVIAKAPNKTLLFRAPMGAGKTTLIKAIAKNLGVSDAGNSPTFGIVNEYQNENGQLLAYHFDFYRLNDETEALDMGLEDYLNQDAYIFIEWPEKIESFLPIDSTEIEIEIIDIHTRRIKLKE
ncbi:tRNA (adenosine(37)-N6)-threonylcarbamoyltransferase complex ATPase subunit type 1 TsaE [Zobellia galactanivorans]|uniref:tRNA threonylcarbamoyladenosine biosynthesis protein TsaE n=1 Tax=Zobellia galactanivorans (strain DSM 12802 / CCUG 47099 / CIP 106680 / NCIMB 13871 / Dsij) TaxID=63186 RepID=G0L6V2_ZOBGA|nr:MULTISPECIES: tRNA (adenosine(37)-N6)-threonylcarbamoyltransferase complex ATPase subunit type 1 TsaE [Zobellia]MBU3025758.1 tRNA (adenosine(37)-N6)-threonylcarbamoyltransferase complex ATPase subunit type 1 TsaE [Zobellia galactanivorans]MDO6809006.1 tRNA (adenosine(37)-N6)-threonylcarbamoyltransferase complex ATPase subunit type 1 TsaE [Zobellia galactanivorans]OWW25978.1 tRNA (adenosine(37)-N6)-threonylcarbamoyltransferase complex ATPase subunit type 1 TsaE [Zobellia sp. OII3]CAZ98665.1 A